MRRITETRLREIEQRAEKATPGPWKAIRSSNYDLSYISGQENIGMVGSLNHVNDADFIAYAREDVPALIAEVRRLRQALTEILEIVDCADYRESLIDALEQIGAIAERTFTE